MEPRIFRQYDIRGVWEEDLTMEAVRAIGRAFAVYVKDQTGKDRPLLTVGGDARLSSLAIREALAGELSAGGLEVVDVGLCATPLQYFSLFHLDADGGIMVTGSHNPPEYNGMKLSLGTETLFGEKIQAIRDIALGGNTPGETGANRAGTVRRYDIIPVYIDYLAKRFGPLDDLHVVVDAGNGTGGLVAPQLMRELGARVTELYCEPDGRFPNHHPDPVVLENIGDLVRKVRETGANLGVGFDGDADRIGVVDEEGEVVWGDRLMILFSRDVLREHPGATVIGEVKCSKTLYDDIAAKGGEPVMWKTGHSLIKKKMKETGALLAGEMSGHIFFADRYFGFDDAVYASLRLLEIVKRAGEPYSLKRLLADVPDTVSTPEIRVECPDERKFEVAERVKVAFADYPVVDIDGVRVTFPDGWGLIRASNTQPALVLRFEAESKAALERIRTTVEGELRKVM